VAVTDTDIARLVEAYSTAASKIDALPNPVEREIGYAALRVDAANMSAWLQTRANAGSRAAPLQAWNTAFQDGEPAIRVVSSFDHSVEKHTVNVVKEVTKWALIGTQMRILASVACVVGSIVLVVVDFGRHVTAGFLTATTVGVGAAGGLSSAAAYGLYRMVASTPQALAAVDRAVAGSWSGAAALGSASQRVLDEVTLPVEHDIQRRNGVTQRFEPSPFIAQVRTRAKAIVGTAIAALIVGVLCLMYGVYSAYSEYQTCNSLRPAFSTAGNLTDNQAGCKIKPDR